MSSIPAIAGLSEPQVESPTTRVFPVCDYDLAATLGSGQAFRWRHRAPSWVGVIGTNWVRLHTNATSMKAEAAVAVSDWRWLVEYLQLDLDIGGVLRTFPEDEPMRGAITACHGLRLLRQEPWECLASFILSSTKQIVQIRQIIAVLCERYGEPVVVPAGEQRAHSFPSPARLAILTESELRDCKMGFRAKYLLAAAQRVQNGEVDLSRLYHLPVESARAELIRLPGVGRKIADCVLLFAYGFQSAFPLDVWVMKALHQLYFPRRRLKLERLHRFAAGHFGQNAGYAQQYLFHYIRVKSREQNLKSKIQAASDDNA